MLTGRVSEPAWWDVLSGEAGYAKPDQRIYHAALRQLAASPGRALFIDDTPGHVAAAEALGLAGHLHISTATTITRIEDFVTAGPAYGIVNSSFTAPCGEPWGNTPR